MALGIAATGSVLTSSYRGHLSTADMPPAVADGQSSSVGSGRSTSAAEEQPSRRDSGRGRKEGEVRL